MERKEPDAFAAGLLLAAIAASDGDASRAALAPALRARIESITHEALRTQDRSAAIRVLLDATTARFDDAPQAMPTRARALIATLAPRDLGSAWMRAAGSPRTGFRVSAALRTTLARTEDAAWRE